MTKRVSGSVARAIGVGALVVLGAIALDASLAALPGPTASTGRSPAGVPAVVLAVVCSLTGLLVLVWSWRLLRRRRRTSDEPYEGQSAAWVPSRRAKLLGLVLALAAMTGPWLLLLATTHGVPTVGAPPTAPSGGVARALASGSRSPVGPGVAGFVLVLTLALVLAAVLAAWWSRRRRQQPGAQLESSRVAPAVAPPPEAAAPSAAAHPWSTNDPDRARVVAAFTALLRVAASHGVAPSPTETPDEFLDRLSANDTAVAGHGAPLTAVFQRARFSPGRLAPGDAPSAEASLAAVRKAWEHSR